MSVLGRKESRLDATLAYQNIAYDIDRVQLKYASRWVYVFDTLLLFYAYMIYADVFIVTRYEVCRELQEYMVLSLLVRKCNFLEQ